MSRLPADASKDVGIPYTSAACLRKARYRWIWDRRIACPSIVLVAGPGGVGKSTLCAEIVASVTARHILPGGPNKGRITGGALWLNAEESVGAKVKTRLRAAGASLRRVYFPGLDDNGQVEHAIEFPVDLHHIRDLVLLTRSKVVVIDPIASYAGGLDLNRQQDVRNLMKAMKIIGDACCVTWILVAHPNKCRTGPMLDRIFGSGALHHVSRSVLLLGHHPSGDGRRVVVHAKGGEEGEQPTLAYKLDVDESGTMPPVIQWLGECPVTKEMLGVESLDAGEQDQHQDARSLLKSILKDWRPAKEVIAEASAAGIGERSLRSAKAELRVPSRRVDNGLATPHWEWGPPDGGWEVIQ